VKKIFFEDGVSHNYGCYAPQYAERESLNCYLG